MREHVSTGGAEEGAGLLARLRETPLQLGLLSFGAGFTAGWLLPLAVAEVEPLAVVRARLLRAMRRGYDEGMRALREALAVPCEGGSERAGRERTSYEQPSHPFESMPAGFPFESGPREFPVDDIITVRSRLSTHDYDDEEPVPDLRNDIVGDEHPF